MLYHVTDDTCQSKAVTTLGVKMKDIAREAGVSTATVGWVLHKRGCVSQGARGRVEAVVEKHGYGAQQPGPRADLQAKRLLCGVGTGVIAFVNGLALMIVSAVLCGVGITAVTRLLQVQVFTAVPENRRGVASSAFMLLGDTGNGIGAAIWGMVSAGAGYGLACWPELPRSWAARSMAFTGRSGLRAGGITFPTPCPPRRNMLQCLRSTGKGEPPCADPFCMSPRPAM